MGLTKIEIRHLEKLENQSVYMIREAYSQFKDIAVLWSMGKDSTTLLWLMRKAFFGKIPFPVIHIDTTYKFREIYEFRDKYAKKWGLDLIIASNDSAINDGISPDRGKLECCTKLKTEALKSTITKNKFRAVFLGIRSDEHGIRAKERCFSPRNENFEWDYKEQPPELWNQYKNKVENDEHLRVHPLLGWREIDIWRYIKKEKVPVIPLYFSKNGKRYRSIGCRTCCKPMESGAGNVDKIIEELKISRISERSGRVQDKESAYMMQKLRSLGYM